MYNIDLIKKLVGYRLDEDKVIFLGFLVILFRVYWWEYSKNDMNKYISFFIIVVNFVISKG